MLRLILSLIIVITVFIYALKYAKTSLFQKPENSVSLVDVGKSIKEIKQNNLKREQTIKQNEKLVEDLDEKN